MKTVNSIRFALLAAAALLTLATFVAKPAPPPPPPPPPSNGTLVLDYSYPGAGYDENFGLTVTPSGTVFASGIAGYGISRGIVLVSNDSGNSWSLADDFFPPGRPLWWWVVSGGIASDAAGRVYTAGLTYADDGISPDSWYVRRSSDGGATWITVDDFIPSDSPSTAGDVTGIATDATGNIYVSGQTDFSGNQAWTIRKGVSGATFSTGDMMPNSYLAAVFAHPTAGIFAVGDTRVAVTIKGKTTTSRAWLVRRSRDGGATWSNVDAFQLSSSLGSWAKGIGADALGNLYVVGRGSASVRNAYVYHWLVRKSTDGGNSWSTVDDFAPGVGIVEARAFGAKTNGDLYVAGTTTSSTGNHWIVRKNAADTGAWSTVDDYQYRGGSTEPRALVADASGNLFVGGSGSCHWLTKKY